MSPRFALALLAALLASAPAAARAGWFNSDWKQRQSIRISNDTDSGLAYYQTRIVVAHRPGMLPDFSDARFTETNGALLSHWVESFVPSESAVFWVKVAHLPARAEQTIHLYFDNAAAKSTSSGAAVFDFFDDFSSGSLEEWATNGAGMRAAGGGLLSVGTTGANHVYTKNFTAANGVVEARVKAARNHNANLAGRISQDAKLSVAAGNAGVFGKLLLFEYQPAFKSLASESFAQGTGFNTFSLRLQHTTAWAQAGAETQTTTPRLEGAVGPPRSGAVGFYLKNSDALVDWFRVRQYAPAEPLAAAGELQTYDGVVGLTRYEKLSCLAASDVAEIKADPAKTLDVFEKCRGELAFKIGFNVSKAELYAAFCAVVSYLSAPYGRSLAAEFEELLREPVLACNNYALLVGHFNELYCDPVTLQFVGMDGGAVGNHAQVFANDRLLLDPTIGLVALASREDVFSGRPVTKIVLFNLRSELAPFRRTVVGALNAGAYKPSDIIYNCETFRAMKDRYGLARNFDGSPRRLPLRLLPGLTPDAAF